MKTTIVIELEIEGDASEAFDVVDRVLDAGTLQDAIHEYAADMERGPLEVTSAVCVVRREDAIPRPRKE